jgi:NDP-sugar pyrophosphorylase family protein
MHIIIPMSGIGNRFIEAGYTIPKPLIEIDGKPMIEHVVNLFPNESKFTFICNTKHLKETNMRNILNKLKPNCTIIEIPIHKKGPVFAVSKMFNIIEDEEEVIVNYCDFGTYWDYRDFLKHTRNRNADGAIPSYKGFHPHMLGSTNYAFIREKKQWLVKIKEKEPFTSNRMSEFASNGTYYFKKGVFVKKYFSELLASNEDINGEYYVSLIFNLLIRDNLKVSIYEIQHMLQWGTPSDIIEYKRWSNYFLNTMTKMEKTKLNAIGLIPLAGFGSRFKNEGYKVPKPLLQISGKAMIVQATDSLPKCSEYRFICLEHHLLNYPLEKELTEKFENSTIVRLKQTTEGQAITCKKGIYKKDLNKKLFIGACDNSMIYDEVKLQELLKDDKLDAIIFTFKNHISSRNNPQMYGWVKTIKDKAIEIKVKEQISNQPENDHAIVGTFYFKTIELFEIGFEQLLSKNIRINNEYYVDSLMNELILLGYNVKVFEVKEYICWGTPNDYKTYNYWQSYFHKTKSHPYSMEKDTLINLSEIKKLEFTYKNVKQQYE